MRGHVLGCVAAVAGLVLAAPAVAVAAKGDLAIEVLSNRADLLSGGDALVRIDGAGSAPVAVDVDGHDISSVFSGRTTALVTGLADGPNELTAAVPDGRRARITLTNHPIGGPVFARPPGQPRVWDTPKPPAHNRTPPPRLPGGPRPPRDAQCN